MRPFLLSYPQRKTLENECRKCGYDVKMKKGWAGTRYIVACVNFPEKAEWVEIGPTGVRIVGPGFSGGQTYSASVAGIERARSQCLGRK